MARDLRGVEVGFARWLRHRRRQADQAPPAVRAELVTGGGYSSDIVVVDVEGGAAEWGSPVVLRMPPEGVGLFRSYDLGMEVAAQEAARRGGVPVPGFVVAEDDPTWIGAPFLLMPKVAGQIPGELAVADEWIMGLGAEAQRTLHGRFFDVLARVQSLRQVAIDLASRRDGLQQFKQ